MAAIVRVKRRVDDEPIAEYVLNAKKRRIAEESNESHLLDNLTKISTVLQFAGTTNSLDDEIISKYAAHKADAEKEFQKKRDFLSKLDKSKEASQRSIDKQRHEKRFQVVNFQRKSLANLSESAETAKVKEFTVLDVEPKSEKCETAGENDVVSAGASNPKYVYDIYLQKDQTTIDMIDYEDFHINVHHELTMDDYFDDEDEHDSEDSNAEDYYTNDYPDEEDCENSDSSSEMCDKFRDCAFSGYVKHESADFSSSDDDPTAYEDPYLHFTDNSCMKETDSDAEAK